MIAPRPPDEEHRLAALHDLKVLDTPAEERFDRYTDALCESLSVPIALITLIDAERQWFKSRRGIVVQIEIASRCLARLKEHRRTLAGRTGCGLCGAESLEHALPPLGGPVRPFALRAAALAAAMRALGERQALQAATGATHAAAWCSAGGEVLLLREDVGRHNALDKLVGALARAGVAPGGGFAAITSRASHEMVHKAARAGIGLLAAISAPTALAIRSAAQAQLCLVGFARGTDWVAYTHPERLTLD